MPIPTTPANPSGLLPFPSVLGPNGKAWDGTNLDASKLAPEQREEILTGSYDAIQYLSFIIPSFNPTDIINQKGYKLMDDMMNMSAYSGPMHIKKSAILYKQAQVLPAAGQEADPSGRAKEAADLCSYVLDNIYDPETGEVQDFRTALWYALDACHIGCSVQEIIWRRIDEGPHKGKLGLRPFSYKPLKQVGFQLDLQTLKVNALTTYTPFEGYRSHLPPEKFLIYTYRPFHNLPYGFGDAVSVYKHVYSLNELYRMWLVAMNRIGVYPIAFTDNPDPSYRDRVRSYLDSMLYGSSAVFPSSLKMEFQNLTGTNLIAFVQAVEYHADAITKTVLGVSLTTQQGNGTGAYALGAIHQNTQEYLLSYIRRDIEALVRNRLLRLIVLYNMGPDYLDVVPTYSLGKWGLDELKTRADIYTALSTAGIVEPGEPFIREDLAIPPHQEPTFHAQILEPPAPAGDKEPSP